MADLMATPPEGFRELTYEENQILDNLALRQMLFGERKAKLEETIRAAENEIKAAKLNLQNVTKELMELFKEGQELDRRLGVHGPDDRKALDGKIYVRKRELSVEIIKKDGAP